MKKSDYLQLKQKIEERHKADISALERVWSLSQDELTPLEAQDFNNGSASPRANTFTDAVRSTILSQEQPFTVRDIMDEVGKTNPDYRKARSAFATIIFRLLKAEKLEINEKGKGRKQGSYKIKK